MASDDRNNSLLLSLRTHQPKYRINDILLAGFARQPFSISGVSKKNSLGNGTTYSRADKPPKISRFSA
ncbi:MAG: hypothetical protein WAM78_05830 [Candidatus Sulfotelmatobacter sp.]